MGATGAWTLLTLTLIGPAGAGGGGGGGGGGGAEAGGLPPRTPVNIGPIRGPINAGKSPAILDMIALI